MPGSRFGGVRPLWLALAASAALAWLYGAMDPIAHYQTGVRY